MGVPQDYVGALAWYLIAAQGGHDDAKAAAERLRKVMSGGDVGRAKSRAEAFRPQSTPGLAAPVKTDAAK